MTNFSNASWRNRPSDSQTIDDAIVLNQRTERGSRNLMATAWALLAMAGIICGLFITGWKEVIGAFAFGIAFSFLLAWIQVKRGRR